MVAQVPDMLMLRSNFSVSVIEDKLVVVGGYTQVVGAPGTVCAHVEIYCPRENRSNISHNTQNIEPSPPAAKWLAGLFSVFGLYYLCLSVCQDF